MFSKGLDVYSTGSVSFPGLSNISFSEPFLSRTFFFEVFSSVMDDVEADACKQVLQVSLIVGTAASVHLQSAHYRT